MRLKDIDNFPLLPNKLDGDESEYEKGYRDATANLNALPTIDPESLRPTGEWISVEDRLPEYGQHIIAYSGRMMEADVFAYIFWDESYDLWQGISHWMPMPEPPNTEVAHDS